VDWIWDKHGNAEIGNKQESLAAIELTQGSLKIKIKIEREEVTMANRTIGVHLDPLGDSKTEYHYRLKYINLWTPVVTLSKIIQLETLCAYRNVFIPSITNPLDAISFSNNQYISLQTLGIKNYLPNLGFNRKFPTAVIFAPTKYRGW